ncbi:phage tail protein [Sphingomonas oryzagri]|uniref:Phage tail protein n=1 Tax=Sphingomonas oryzagri TaxID=3042314 RepID=A0ABT6N482_9SPHN|nr:phage tail protein [Sphingomonas oryzagri]MDH7639573.1 phage tail protein [Sphingomonas oryzagri]
MATLVLTAVGTVVGGPIGAAIGAVIGNQIDRAIFTPKGAKGPRLDSLAVQGSSYGADLPRLFGTMRASGSVIWATDLRESTHKSGGKGKPATTTYSYSASFAVVLSARPVRTIHRIWADGALLRGAAKDWKTDVGAFRLHTGEDGQAIDPLIAAAEGIDATPAHRGLAYAVFEDLQLADYGNRIPSLSFEVEADDGAVSLTTIAAILSESEVSGAGGPLLGGYAASGDSLRGAIEGLGSALPVAFADGADGLHLVDETAAPLDLPVTEMGAFASGAKPVPRVVIERQAAGTLNEALSIGYYDPALDYQIGSQSARRDVSARRAGAIDLPAAVDASSAQSIVEARLAREWAGRTTARLALPLRHLDIAAGAIVAVPGQNGRWRVTERAFEDMVLTLTVQRLPPATGDAPPASSGSGLSQPDLPHGPTTLALLDLPSLGDDPATAPTLLVAAAGEQAGWRKAALTLSLDDGASWQAIGGTAAPAIIGQAVTVLVSGSSAVRDDANSVDILLLNDAMALASSDATSLSAATNLALLGDELIQFASAEQIGPRLFRLAGLLRGRRGSEWAIGGHAIGDRFVLVDPDALLAWPLPLSAIGRSVRVSANGVGDSAPAEADLTFQARAMRPPAPVALLGTAMPDGSVSVGWTRRSRAGWDWLDDTDVPLAEETERYQILLSRPGGVDRLLTVAEPVATIAPADLDALGGAGPLTITIAQIGTTAASLPPATLTMTSGA